MKASTTTTLTSKTILKQSVADPIVHMVCMKTAFLIIFYRFAKRKYYDKYIKQDGLRLSFRLFEAITSERYLRGEFPTRGAHAGRSGKISTIPFDLYVRMRDAIPTAEKELSAEFHSKRMEIKIDEPDGKKFSSTRNQKTTTKKTTKSYI